MSISGGTALSGSNVGSVLSNPNSLSHQTNFNFAGTGPASTGSGLLGIGSSSPEVNFDPVSVSDPNDYHGDTTNGTQDLALVCSTADYKNGDWCAGLMHFVHKRVRTKFDVVNPDRSTRREFMYQPYSWPALQHKSLYEPIGHEMGQYRNALTVRGEFGPVGILETAECELDVGSSRKKTAKALTFIISGKRTYCPNVWAAYNGRKTVSELNVCYTVLRRIRIDPTGPENVSFFNNNAVDEIKDNRKRKHVFGTPVVTKVPRQNAISPATMQATKTNATLNFSLLDMWSNKTPQTNDAMKIDFSKATDPSSTTMQMTTEDLQPNPDKSCKYRWVWMPQVGNGPPNPGLWTGMGSDDPYNQYIGDFIRNGTVLHVAVGSSTGQEIYHRTQGDLARDVLYPKERNMEWYGKAASLGKLNLSVHD